MIKNKELLHSKMVAIYKPVLLNLADNNDKEKLADLIAKKSVLEIIDDYIEQLKELYQINNPTKVYTDSFQSEFDSYLNALKAEMGGDLDVHGTWVFFPWTGTLVHVLDDHDFQRVRTARNRNLINEEEQARFYNSVVGIGGLSVGNSIALSIVLQGGARHIKLADFDKLSLSNLNRVRADVSSLGVEKVVVTARQIYLLNPYAEVEIFRDGLSIKNLDTFFKNLDVVVDELDNLSVKYLIREYARKYKVPVVMGADDGDNAVIDIERYDLNQKTRYFHGRLGNVTYESLKNLDKFGIGRTITKHIGPENITERMQKSLLEMGKTIVSWPQLGGAALLNGMVVAYAVRKIVNKQSLQSNRAIVSIDEKLEKGYLSKKNTLKRMKTSTAFAKRFKL